MENKEQTIYQMVENVRNGTLSRRNLVKILTAMGISSAGVGAISTVTLNSAARKPQAITHADEQVRQNLNLHDKHLAHQSQSNVGALHNDYAENAIVEDSSYAMPFAGREAIMARKQSGMSAVSSAQITVTNRIAHGEQVIVEWVATGIHTGDIAGHSATGRSYSLKGVTVVIRQNGKIVRESIYYDTAELHRQLGPN
jgi:steroid delta-isomerase-like uncharacterized protein